MRIKTLHGIAFWSLAMLLAACGGPATPTPAPTTERSPTSLCPSVETTTMYLVTPQPADVLLELAWEGGFTRPEIAYAFGRVPEFSLLPDGSVYYRDPSDWDTAQMMKAQLTQAETDDLLLRVLGLGIERLESYTEQCRPEANGTCLCIADAGESVLRVRLPGGALREIRNYADFANDPEALWAIRNLLEEYRHPQAQSYAPEKAAIFVRPVSPSPDLHILDWPQPGPPAWLAGGTPDASCVRAVSGGKLQALVAATGRNMGDFTFHAGEQGYGLYLVPWLPGVDYADLIASSGQACPGTETTSPPDETGVSPCAKPATEARWRLSAEEHSLFVTPLLRELGRTTGPGFWAYFETTDRDTGQILARNQTLRDVDGLRLTSYNATLEPYGYRLVLTKCGEPSSGQYALYQGVKLTQDSTFGRPAVSANASSTNFVMQLELAAHCGYFRLVASCTGQLLDYSGTCHQRGGSGKLCLRGCRGWGLARGRHFGSGLSQRSRVFRHAGVDPGSSSLR